MTTTRPSAAAPKKLYLFQLSATTVPITPDRTIEMILPCYLVQTSDSRNILIDTGMAPDFPRPAGFPPSRDVSTVLDQLARLNLRPADIDTVICTHFDVDHIGFNEYFSHAEFVVQREHFAIARDGHPRFASTRAHWDRPGLRWHLLDGDTEFLPGLTLLETSGHVAGHQSVLVRLPQCGNILLAIDAVMMQSQFTPDRKPGPKDDDAEKTRASTSKLLEIVKNENVALTVFGHDGAQWPHLKRSPDCYI
jgi:N-acyl homoserine lactone hydrolase